jgi:GTP cyclohydrolase IA
MFKGKLMSVSDKIKAKLLTNNVRYWANDNIADYINDEEKAGLIDELEEKFEAVLDSLLIDRMTDPNSKGTPRRLAKMYINEIMSGRYQAQPPVTAFPNDNADTRYGGMIVVRSEIKSMCSHHHQPVSGVAYIGLIPGVKVIGLSKYTRIAQHCARRGTLQEELTQDIANEIAKHTGAKDIAVYIQGTHGCCENRGIMAHSSLTQTCELRGQFFNPSVKNEFLDYIKMQQVFAGNRV